MTKTESFEFECPECGRGFANISNMRKHVRTIHEVEPVLKRPQLTEEERKERKAAAARKRRAAAAEIEVEELEPVVVEAWRLVLKDGVEIWWSADGPASSKSGLVRYISGYLDGGNSTKFLVDRDYALRVCRNFLELKSVPYVEAEQS